MNDYYNNPSIQSRRIAYCQGFADGYKIGVDSNPYDGGSPDQKEKDNQLFYRIGYDAGVAEYCSEVHPEDEE